MSLTSFRCMKCGAVQERGSENPCECVVEAGKEIRRKAEEAYRRYLIHSGRDVGFVDYSQDDHEGRRKVRYRGRTADKQSVAPEDAPLFHNE